MARSATGGCDLMEPHCWCRFPAAVRTTPAAVCGRGFPSLSKEGNFRGRIRQARRVSLCSAISS